MDGLDPLQVGTPAFIGLIVGVADIMSDLVAFATDAAYLGHCCSFQSDKIFFCIDLVHRNDEKDLSLGFLVTHHPSHFSKPTQQVCPNRSG
jgi:hypothetical protein